MEERIVESSTPWRGRIFSVELDKVELPDGGIGEREIVRHRGGACVAAVRDGQICLVRQYRIALGRETLEVPAGKLEVGEDPLECARRELEEEAGLCAESLEQVATTAGSPGFTDELTRIFLARGLTQHEAHPDPDEFVECVWMPLSEAIGKIRSLEIQDAKTVVAILVAARELGM